ncbi:MAG: hypothetical protein HEEMFOPI_01137 [Holosporales bacterium]
MFILVVFFVCINVECYSMTQDIAAKRCARELSLYDEVAAGEGSNQVLPIKKLILSLIEKIKKAEIQSVPDLLSQCLRGVDALAWIVEQYNQNLKDGQPEISRMAQDKTTETKGGRKAIQ